MTESLIGKLQDIKTRDGGAFNDGLDAACEIVIAHAAEQPQDVVERVASAIDMAFENMGFEKDPKHDALWHKQISIELAKAAIAAMRQHEAQKPASPSPAAMKRAAMQEVQEPRGTALKPEGQRTKAEEWQACYDSLFNQLNPVMEENARLKAELAGGEIPVIADDYSLKYTDYKLFLAWSETQGGNIDQSNYEAWKAGFKTGQKREIGSDALREAVAMADEARKYLLEHPSNKVKCNIMLLRLVQKFSNAKPFDIRDVGIQHFPSDNEIEDGSANG